jgi:hypothetical protein
VGPGNNLRLLGEFKRLGECMTTDQLRVQYYQFLVTKSHADKLKKRQEQLRLELMAEAKRRGEQTPEGHFRIIFDEAVNVDDKSFSVMKAERRVARYFNFDKAEELLVSKGLYSPEKVAEIENLLDQLAEKLLDEYDQPVEIDVEVRLSQDDVYGLFQEGKLTEEEVLSLEDEDESWAFQTRG